MLTELIRLPVAAGREQDLLEAIEGLDYFGPEGPSSFARLVAAEGEPAVLLVFEWPSREASRAAIDSEAGEELLDLLRSFLTGPPELSFYRAAGR